MQLAEKMKNGNQRCQCLTQAGQQCKKTAEKPYNMCFQHGFSRRYYIQIMWQENAGDHWTMRRKAVWPIVFRTSEEAWEHLNSVRVFKNLPRKRKMTASVEYTKRYWPNEGLINLETGEKYAKSSRFCRRRNEWR